MNYTIIYEPDYSRILPAILIDCRATIPEIKNQTGNIILAYTNSQIDLIKSNSIFYKIETEKGVIAAVFSIDVDVTNKTAVLNINLLRPAFVEFNSEIQNQITNFISSNLWQQDYLF